MKLGIISIIMGSVCIVYYFLAIKIISFSSFFGIVGILLVVYGLYKLIFKKGTIMEKAPGLVFMVKIIFSLLIISFIVIEGVVIFKGQTRNTEPAEYIVILGAMVRGDTPSLILQERLDAGLQCIKEHPGAKIILSGGRGPGEDISEAEAMKRYIVSKGIEGARIIKEDKSTSTIENLNFTKRIIDKENTKIIIVTSEFHMFRAEFLAKRNGFEVSGYKADTYILLRPTYYIREYFAVIKSFLFDKA